MQKMFACVGLPTRIDNRGG